MKLRIGDADYDYKTAIRRITLRDLMRLQSQGGPNRRQIQLAWDLIDQALRKGDGGDDVIDQPEVLLGMAGTIFVCKAYEGEQVSWDDAQGFAWPEDVRFIVEDEDVAVDPPVASGEASQPDAATKNVKRSPKKTPAASTSKTSKRPSSTTSS